MLHSVLCLLVLLAVMMLPMVAVEHWMWALVVTFEIARRACLMARMNFQNQWALCLRHLCCTLGILGILLVDPLRFEFGTLVVTFRVRIAGPFIDIALSVARLDCWEILAGLHDRCPWLGALGMAVDILAALLVAGT